MKKSYIILAAALVGLGATSCSDFLEEDNKTGEAADLTYQTVSGIDGLVSSAYAYCRGWWGKEPSLGLAEGGTDIWYYGYDNKQKSLCSYDITAECYGYTSTSGTNAVNDNACLDQYWELFFAGIDVCNSVLKYTPLCNVIEPSQKAAYQADALFLRALYYSQMVAIWGPVPYNSEAFTAVNTAPVREPEAVVYKKILADLEQSMKLYKEANVMKIAQATGNGRAYYYSAEALYARVALTAASWLGKNAVEGYSDLYATAAQAADDVIKNSGASLYARTSDTWNMNNEEANKNTENLFATHYNNVLNAGRDNCVPFRFANDESNYYEEAGVKRGIYNSLLTRKGYGNQGGSASLLMFVSLWNNGCADLGGSGNKTTTVFQRVTSAATGLMPSKTTGTNIDCTKYYSPYGRGFSRYLPSLYLWTILDEIKETDQRYNATLLTHYNIPQELAGNPVNYPKMGEQTFKNYEEAYAEDGNYFNGGGYAILYSLLDGNSAEGQALQAEAKDKYRLQFAFGGDIPVYTSGDMSKALPTEGAKKVSDVYGDARYNDAKIEGRRSYPGIKKFLDDQVDPNYLTYDISYRDIMVLRLAEMYLIKAEAELSTGGNAKATLNELRHARAIKGMETANEVQGNVDIETILKERAIELCGEYSRWFDLKRTHTLIDHVKKYNAQASANIAAKHYYRPIPQTQFESISNEVACPAQQDANGVLQYSATADGFWQNPGY